MSRKDRLEFLEKKLDTILREISLSIFELSSHDFDFYNDTNYKCNYLRELINDLQDTNDEICDILDRFFETTGEYPETKHYGT